MEKLKNKIALVTGATSGIGKATAIALAEEGCNVIITGRRKDRLNELSQKLTSELGVKCHPLNFDISDLSAVKNAVHSLDSFWSQIDILVNNAGLASGFGKLHEGDPEDWEIMIDTNIKGLLYITREIVPGMVERGRGDVVNIGSIAGHETYPNGNVYCATKHAVTALTRGLRYDLIDTPIRVSTVDPGMVETEFSMVRFKGNEERAKSVYAGVAPLKGEDIAQSVVFIVTRPAHVQIAEIIVFATAQAAATTVHRK